MASSWFNYSSYIRKMCAIFTENPINFLKKINLNFNGLLHETDTIGTPNFSHIIFEEFFSPSTGKKEKFFPKTSEFSHVKEDIVPPEICEADIS